MKNIHYSLGLIALITFFSSAQSQSIKQKGVASYYADKFEGRTTASGEKYKHSKLTAAHKTLPFGTMVKVKNLANGKSVEVKINDRGPYVDGRIIDLSKSAATKLDFIHAGLTEVEVEVIDAVISKESSYNPGKPASTEEVVDEKEFYEFTANRYNPKGFGIQIGSYQEMVNLVRVSNNLKKSYRKTVTVSVAVINNVKVYKIIVGKEKTRAKAEILLVKLKVRYPDSFIVDFNKL